MAGGSVNAECTADFCTIGINNKFKRSLQILQAWGKSAESACFIIKGRWLRTLQILKDIAELESAKQEGLVVERAYKALRRSYDTKINQEKALLARLQERWQVPEMRDAFTWNDLFPDEKVSREFLDAFVPRIISIDGERLIWELQLMQNHCTVQCEREGAGADAQIRVGKIVQEPPE